LVPRPLTLTDLHERLKRCSTSLLRRQRQYALGPGA